MIAPAVPDYQPPTNYCSHAKMHDKTQGLAPSLITTNVSWQVTSDIAMTMTMTIPSSRIHLLSSLLLAATIAATADEPSTAPPPPPPITLRPDCPDRCGDVSIPYPFGTKDGCFLPGFQVICNTAMDPPRAFLAADNPISGNWTISKSPYMMVGDYFYSGNADSRLINQSVSPVELLEVSLPEGQARVRGGFSFDCRLKNETRHAQRIQHSYFPAMTPFQLSKANELTVVGRGVVEAELKLDSGLNQQVRTAGACSGQGWCGVDIIPYTASTLVLVKRRRDDVGDWWQTSPCSYGMVVEKSWYNFSGEDLDGDSFLQRHVARGVPVLLDFGVRNVSCPDVGEPNPPGYACVSKNSWCIDATSVYESHRCVCSDGYQGNPYIPDGCQDIDECKQSNLYPCHGICENFLGGYNCTCPATTRGNGKESCNELFPRPAKISIGVACILLVASILVFGILLRKEKKKMRDFFEKNGGSYILENAKRIEIYRWKELKPILKSSNFIGKGCFGEVYQGFIGKELVAVKKPISKNNAAHNKQFANEVAIQSLMIHKNIVKLRGCCLEVEVPILVYEFVSKGSLDDILHGDNNGSLDLYKRLTIAAESAEGLAYMHSQVGTQILHGDVKPGNILLDDNFSPKISDFGISRLIGKDKEHAKYVIGDISYMDPTYLRTGLLTHKSDVYSFGIVLLELISRKKATHSENNNIVNYFLNAHEKGMSTNELFDKEIALPEYLELLNNILAIAIECLNLDVGKRPEMKEVEERLRTLKRSCVKDKSSLSEQIDDVK